MDLGLRGKVAIVGGASKGLGRASAERLAAEGAKVAMCARDEAVLVCAAEEIKEKTGAELLPIKADLSKAEDIERAVSRATATLGPIAVAVCNLGGPPVVPFEELADSHWQQSFELTFMSVVRLMRAVLPGMRAANWGRLLAIQSSSIKQPVAGLHLSNAIRPGVAGLFKTSIGELAKHNITANVVLPGMYLTDRSLSSQRAGFRCAPLGFTRFPGRQESVVEARRQQIQQHPHGEQKRQAKRHVGSQKSPRQPGRTRQDQAGHRGSRDPRPGQRFEICRAERPCPANRPG